MNVLVFFMLALSWTSCHTNSFFFCMPSAHVFKDEPENQGFLSSVQVSKSNVPYSDLPISTCLDPVGTGMWLGGWGLTQTQSYFSTLRSDHLPRDGRIKSDQRASALVHEALQCGRFR